MIRLENTETLGWEHAIRGMRNPMNSWEKGDSTFCKRNDCLSCEFNDSCGTEYLDFDIGPEDYDLMLRLRNAGTDHRKYMRMIVVYVDITAPLYWWKEFDTYKVGTVANSCSTMHKIHAKEFTIDDFSNEHLIHFDEYDGGDRQSNHAPFDVLQITVNALNHYRLLFLKSKDKKYWWQMIQLLPSSYNQRRTVMLNYEVLANIYKSRKAHKLDEWRDFCKWIESLPYKEIITGGSENE